MERWHSYQHRNGKSSDSIQEERIGLLLEGHIAQNCIKKQVSTTTGEESKLKCLCLINICLVIWQFSHGLDLWYTTREGLNPTSLCSVHIELRTKNCLNLPVRLKISKNVGFTELEIWGCNVTHPLFWKRFSINTCWYPVKESVVVVMSGCGYG